MIDSADMAIVGAGPSGCAAGIWAQIHGLSTILLERKRSPRERPGETLHPGITSILRQLGVYRDVRDQSRVNPRGIHSVLAGRPQFLPYGGTKDDPWLGFQVNGADLDAILMRRYLSLGGRLVCPVQALGPIVKNGRVLGVETSKGALYARWVIDASGRSALLRRRLEPHIQVESPRLLVSYGRRTGRMESDPRFICNANGWVWLAQIDSSLISWATLAFPGAKREAPIPDDIARLPHSGRRRSADVTWRIWSRSAGPGYFAVGEAASVVDPASSKGVLRAVMSGIMAAHRALEVTSHREAPAHASLAFSTWTTDCSKYDKTQLCELYRSVGVEWAIAELGNRSDQAIGEEAVEDDNCGYFG